MNEALRQQLDRFKDLVKKMSAYEEALGVLYWDMRTGAPRKGIAARSETVGMLSTELFKMSVSDEMGAYVQALSTPEAMAELGAVEQKMVRECRKEYERSRKIPPEQYQEYVVLTSQAESIWEEAKEQRDFAMFQPYLEQIVDFNRRFIQLWGVKDTPYDTLLDMYEPGMTVAQLDRVFGELRERIVPLVAAIRERGDQPDTAFLKQPFEEAKQREFGEYILREMGYDFDAGRLDKSVHPFATGLNPGDVRITTNFKPDDIEFSLFSSIHEGGHALYEQNVSADLVGTGLATGTSMGIHESQSRFWENLIGRGLPFWKAYYGKLQEIFPHLRQFALSDFYRAMNKAEPSLIRIEADELTYNLHIMIRYELEKALFNGELAVTDLPAAWNDKYDEYLGLRPSHDGEGVLQDVHWAGGAFGYFPSYALGNMYAAQILDRLSEALPDYESSIERKDLSPIKEWLTDRIYRHGKLLDPAEIMERVTGEALNPTYLVNYLENKFKDVYRL